MEDLLTYKTNGWLPKTFMSDNKWPTLYRIRNVGIKTLLLHGGEDEVVPTSMVYELQKMKPDCELLVIPKAGHHQLWKEEIYYQKIKLFIL